MVLAEIIWKGTYEELNSRYRPVHAAIALGNLRERRARELIEWLMLDIPDGVKGSEAHYMIISEALGEIGSPESVPALLLAIEKGVYSNALLKCADESSLPFLRDAANNSMNEVAVSVARYHIMKILEAQQEE